MASAVPSEKPLKRRYLRRCRQIAGSPPGKIGDTNAFATRRLTVGARDVGGDKHTVGAPAAIADSPHDAPSVAEHGDLGSLADVKLRAALLCRETGEAERVRVVFDDSLVMRSAASAPSFNGPRS